jgi:tetratricopeptide (TPR) repeat protein
MGEDRGATTRDFFISFTGADLAWARWIDRELKEAGYTTAFHPADVQPGANFVLYMDRAVREADRLLIVLSRRYQEALFTGIEWSAFLATDPRRDRLVPVRIEDFQPEGLLAALNRIDLVGFDETTARRHLRERIAGLVRGRGQPPVVPPAQMERRPSAVGQPRFPIVRPGIWNVPHRRNSDFHGREVELVGLARQLDRAPSKRAIQTIQGTGGIGKTAMATEYAYRHRSDLDVVWWVRADEPATLVGDYAGLAAELGLREAQAPDQQAAVAAARRWLERHDRWLLILDNAMSPMAQTGLRPHLSRLIELVPQVVVGQVLVTTRDRSWEDNAEPLRLGLLRPEDAVRFLLRRSGSDDRQAAAEVADLLGYLALALEQAGAYIRETRIALSGYLDLLRQFPGLMLAKGSPRDRDPPDTVATTWLLSLEQVEKTPGALSLLEVAAFLAPRAIPRDLFDANEAELPDELDGVPAAIALAEAVGALHRYALVDADERLLDVNRLLQQVVRGRLDDATAGRRIGWAIRRLAALFPDDPHREIGSWPTCEQLLSHVLTAAKYAERRAVEVLDTGWLLDRAAVYLQGRSRYLEARELLERALALAERSFPAATSRRLNNLGYLLLEAGDPLEARDVLERALTSEQAKHEPDQGLVGILLDNLGHALLDLGDPGFARDYIERGLAIREALLGPGHADLAISLNNLGQALEALGQTEQARRCYERALAVKRSAPGREDRELAKIHHSLGMLLLKRGDPSGARHHLEQAPAILEAVLGPDHLDVAKALWTLGRVLQDLGDWKPARYHLDRAQDISSRNLGGG